MYLQFFGLSEAPFSITPDPAFVYLSAAHRDALAHLLYGVGQGGSGGFVQLTGEVGTGKTTLCRCLLEQVPDDTKVALVLNSLVTPQELLATVCEELGIDTGAIADSNKLMVDALSSYLLDQHGKGRRVVVVIDEAQNLSPEALEQVRLLTNLETSKDKLLQMVLLGQPELRQLLQRSDLRQLSQRITARYHLTPLNHQETRAYVKHRMQVAGAQRNPFRRSAIRTLYARSGGVPRLINIIADRALSSAYAKESGSVTSAFVNAAANEVQPSEAQMHPNRWPVAVATASVAALVAVSFFTWGFAPFKALIPSSPPVQQPVVQSELLSRPAEPMTEPVTHDVVSDTEWPVGASVSAPVPESAPPLQLEGAWLNEQHRLAWRTMAELWQDGQSAPAIASACDGVPGNGYSCLRDQGNWSRIQKLGLPVILILHDESPKHLVLRGFAPDGLLLGAGDGMTTMPREAIEQLWLGEYMVTWPQAPDWPLQISRGQSGAAVDIVLEMAGFAEQAWTGSGDFDAGFESWLMGFQRRHGLRADGIVGPRTLIYLMAPTIVQPRLILPKDKRS
ncbi:MAG: AAA family ATPase [Xanthomonadales bacterium]|nr:AAA family ATPase [Gammaproteobacteria bacterium]MBT8054987.1 AAA family ATPase [Gammaproteobacteria bacterium]NND56369.1 AAA family ATPase [Xanthomonadales bacterium]NNK50426.1 AAA family ATPase [Xanthomonadales bacterium]